MQGKKLVRRLVASGLWPMAKIRESVRPGWRILMYHRVDTLPAYDQLTVQPAHFQAQMEALAERYAVVGLDDGLRELSAGRLARPMVSITFDDGYLDNLRHAVPILSRLGLPATIFVTTRFCDQTASHPRYPADGHRLHLNWDEVRELAATPGISIGSHTASHPHLPAVSDEQARDEIAGSRGEIEARLGAPVRWLCYPSGDFGAREARLAREAGYVGAVSVAPGANHPRDDLFALNRTEVTDLDSVADLGFKLSGAFDPVHALMHWRRTRRFARMNQTAAAAVPSTSRTP